MPNLHADSQPASNRPLFIGTFAVALVEWLMFELLRTPYAPPSELTLLGTEKYAVAGFMVCLIVFWSAYIAYVLIFGKLTIRKLMIFVAMICGILAFFSFILNNPFRPVSSWEAMWL